ncbi:hypothetical protein KM043_018230 [Ampulex compressa]|nr:hypothetical protein KM043_018230 [Ampulex compressa]
MGCELSKLATLKSQPQTTMDPQLPLTARQKFTVMASWKAVSRALEPTGVYMLISCAFGVLKDNINVRRESAMENIHHFTTSTSILLLLF